MIYPLKPTQKLNINVSYPHVGIITYADDTTLKYAASNEPGGPVAIAYADNWMQGDSNSVFFSKDDTLMRTDSEPVEVLTNITLNSGGVTYAGLRQGIKSIQLDATFLDFTLGSFSAIEAQSGRTLSTEGFVNEAEVFTNPNIGNLELLEALETAKLTIKHDEKLWVMEGRANREEISFMVEPEDTALPVKDGELDLSDPRFSHFEVIGGNGAKVSSLTDGRMISGSKMRARLGDMQLTNTATLEMTFVAYVHGDDLGVVLTASLQVPLAKASVLRRRDIVS